MPCQTVLSFARTKCTGLSNRKLRIISDKHERYTTKRAPPLSSRTISSSVNPSSPLIGGEFWDGSRGTTVVTSFLRRRDEDCRRLTDSSGAGVLAPASVTTKRNV